VDAERERISLGIKQLDRDPFSSFLAEHSKGSIVVGEVSEVDARGAVINLAEGVEGHIRASELDRERVEDARTVLKVGDKLEAKFVGVDRKKRTISLSVKAKDSDEEAAAVEEYSASVAGVGATLGDILKAQMGSGEPEEGDGTQDADEP
jgi:small subunit ribosomal protein S1